MPYTIATVAHIFACFFMVIVVLLQTGKGADVGAVFGGSSQTVFGSSGAGNFLTKMTTGIAILFMCTSLFLSYGAAQRTTESLFDSATPVTPVSPSAQTEQPQAASESESSPQSGASEETGTSPQQTADPLEPQATAPANTQQTTQPAVEASPAGETASTETTQPAPSESETDPLSRAQPVESSNE